MLFMLELITMEIGLVTPAFGVLLLVMKGIAPFDVTLGQVVGPAASFILIELFVLALLVALPEEATCLPDKVI